MTYRVSYTYIGKSPKRPKTNLCAQGLKKSCDVSAGTIESMHQRVSLDDTIEGSSRACCIVSLSSCLLTFKGKSKQWIHTTVNNASRALKIVNYKLFPSKESFQFFTVRNLWHLLHVLWYGRNVSYNRVTVGTGV